jgi:chromosomal replication initiation ATPase DnaA
MRKVSAIVGVGTNDITGPSRARSATTARILVVWLLHRKYPAWSLSQLAASVNRRDHGTAIYALARVTKLMQTDPKFVTLINRAVAW